MKNNEMSKTSTIEQEYKFIKNHKFVANNILLLENPTV